MYDNGERIKRIRREIREEFDQRDSQKLGGHKVENLRLRGEISKFLQRKLIRRSSTKRKSSRKRRTKSGKKRPRSSEKKRHYPA